ncbi:MAG TPA: hypothetical protein VJP45_07815 [Candidatus Limnocylindria bacterium]|nr:hypothetical protein [Candidatus Limnocylindria bacterium]
MATVAFALLLPAFIALLVADAARPPVGVEAGAGDDVESAYAASADVPAPKAAALHSRWVSQSPLRVLTLGETGTIFISFRNVGSTPWIRGTAAEARLGVINDDRRYADLGFAHDWPAPDRPAVQTENVVAPGSIANFTFQVRGSVTGVHRIPVRPLVEGVSWMEDEGAYVEFWVR